MIYQQEVAILVSFLFTMSGKIDKLKKIFMSVLDQKTVHLLFGEFQSEVKKYLIVKLVVNVG